MEQNLSAAAANGREERTMVEVDGSYGEGGGQILRTSLALSLLTGRSIHIRHIRAGRPQPGLKPQHLKALEAAAVIGGARVEGAGLGKGEITFAPGEVRPGSYRFDIGTAGSTSLVIQTVLLPLAFAPSPSRLDLIGGTHVPWSPCFHYLERHWLPYLHRSGFEAHLSLKRAGFYPRGGGEVLAEIGLSRRLKPLDLTRRGDLRQVRCLSIVTGLDLSIAHRQMQRALSRLKGEVAHVETEIARIPGPSKGAVLFLQAEFEYSRCCYYALGERGKPAERVADEAVEALERFIASDGAVDPYLADQLVLPLAFAEGTSQIRTAEITGHLMTNIWVMGHFLPVEIAVRGKQGESGEVVVRGRGRRE